MQKNDLTNNRLFSDEVAIDTGAGQGIGFEICRQLALQGCKVVLNDISKELASNAAHQITDEGGICAPIAGDVSDLDFLDKMVTFAINQFDHISLLAANAGITVEEDFFKFSLRDFQRIIDVNLKGTFFLTQKVASQMRRQNKGGKIVLTSSVTGHQAHKYLTPYGMTKAALEMMAKGLVVELSPCRININTVAPGATLTQRTQKNDANYEKTWSQITPMGRPAIPLDIANAVCFLLSRQADHITGQSLIIDGGWSSVSPQPE
jgi:3-oxoacyl-[acyl-carrier protein] reductase